MTHGELQDLAAKGIQAEITRLQALLAEVTTSKRGRPRKSAAPDQFSAIIPATRKMSAAGRKAISDAAKARWAARRKAGQKH